MRLKIGLIAEFWTRDLSFDSEQAISGIMDPGHFGIGLIVAVQIAMLITMVVIAKRKNGKILLQQKPQFLETVLIQSSPEHLFEQVKDLAVKRGLKVVAEEVQPQRSIVLKDGFSISSWGFFYVIYFGKNQLQVGIKSRFRQDQEWNPIRKAKFKDFIGWVSSLENRAA